VCAGQHLLALIEHNRGWRIQHRLLRYLDERARARTRWAGALVETSVPLAMIKGAAESVCGRHVAEASAVRHRHAALEVLDDIGHYPHRQAPSAVSAAWCRLAEGTELDLGWGREGSRPDSGAL
jgi:pimeloyl-ACP methyl ester carboxylesterase